LAPLLLGMMRVHEKLRVTIQDWACCHGLLTLYVSRKKADKASHVARWQASVQMPPTIPGHVGGGGTFCSAVRGVRTSA
jgi:hypothetical protein